MACILPLTEDYIDQVCELEKASFSEPWSKMTFVKELEKSQTHYYMATQEEQVIGYAGMWVVLDEAHIMNIAVDKSQRRNGIGKKLVKTLLEKAKELELIGLTLEVRAGNAEAINLYESLGFVSVASREDYYHSPLEDAIIMWNYFGDGSQV